MAYEDRIMRMADSVPQRTVPHEAAHEGTRNIPRDFWDRRFNRDTTTVPEGFNDPDRFGRMRPTQANNPYAGRINNNPMGGANIGGGWNQYEGGPERRWEYLTNPMSSGSFLSSRFGGGIDDAAGMNEQQTAYNVGDTYPLEGLGRKRPYGGTLDMGPQYEELETIPLDLQFDQWGYPIGQDDWGYGFGAARGGLMSLRR